MAKLTPRQVQQKSLQEAFAPKLAAHVKAIAEEVGAEAVATANSVGIGIETIITLLIPMLLNLPCFKQTAKPPAEFLASHWDGDEYSRMIVRRARPETRQAARKDGKDRLKPHELDLITIAAFDRARLNPAASADFAAEFYAAHG